MRRHTALPMIAPVVSSTASAWHELDAVATRCRTRVILAPFFRPRETPRRRIVRAWRFPDASHVVIIDGPKYPKSVEVIEPNDVDVLLIRDTRRALRTLLHNSGAPFVDELTELWLQFHGALPPLELEEMAGALQSPSREVRLAAIASVGRSRAITPTDHGAEDLPHNFGRLTDD